MLVNVGSVIDGHPYIEILVSPDGKTSTKYDALVDTGFSGFVSLPSMAANLLGLRTHATTRYVLANGKTSDPVPLAYGYACLEGDPFVQGLVSISEHSSSTVGVDFLLRCGKVLMLSTKGVVMVNEAEFFAVMHEMADAENAKAEKPNQ